MKKSEIAKILTYLYADKDRAVPPEKIDVWYEAFSHLDFDEAFVAAKYLQQNIDVYGAPDVRCFKKSVEAVRSLGRRDLSVDETHFLLLGAVRRFGRANRSDGIQSLPEPLRELARRWWDPVCMSSESDYGFRTSLLLAITQELERHAMEAAISVPLRKQIEMVNDAANLDEQLVDLLPEPKPNKKELS